MSLNAVRALIAALRLGACRAILAPFAHKAHCLARQKQAAKAGDKLAMRARHMESAGDRAHSLQEELVEAMDAVDRGEPT